MDSSRILGSYSDTRRTPDSGITLPVELVEVKRCYRYEQHGGRVGFYLSEAPLSITEVRRDDGVIFSEVENDAPMSSLQYSVRKNDHNLGFLWFSGDTQLGRVFSVTYQGGGLINHVENALYMSRPPLDVLLESPMNPPESWVGRFEVLDPEGVDVWITGQGGKGEDGNSPNAANLIGIGTYGAKWMRRKIHIDIGEYEVVAVRAGRGGLAAVNTAGGGWNGESIVINKIEDREIPPLLAGGTMIPGGRNQKIDKVVGSIATILGGGGGGEYGSGNNFRAFGGCPAYPTPLGIDAQTGLFDRQSDTPLVAQNGGIAWLERNTLWRSLNAPSARGAGMGVIYNQAATTPDYWIRIEARAIDIDNGKIKVILSE